MSARGGWSRSTATSWRSFEDLLVGEATTGDDDDADVGGLRVVPGPWPEERRVPFREQTRQRPVPSFRVVPRRRPKELISVNTI